MRCEATPGAERAAARDRGGRHSLPPGSRGPAGPVPPAKTWTGTVGRRSPLLALATWVLACTPRPAPTVEAEAPPPDAKVGAPSTESGAPAEDAGTGSAETEKPPPADGPAPPEREADPRKPKIDVERREVRVKARVCLSFGILEFLMVRKGGREHEAVFSTRCLPSRLHLALLLIGLEPSGAPYGDEAWYEAARESKRSRLKVHVEIEEGGETERLPVSRLLHSREAEEGEVPDTWVFTGSGFMNRDGRMVYAADETDAVISIIPGPAVVHFATETGNPYTGDYEGIEVDGRDLPEIGEEVTLVFSPWWADGPVPDR